MSTAHVPNYMGITLNPHPLLCAVFLHRLHLCGGVASPDLRRRMPRADILVSPRSLRLETSLPSRSGGQAPLFSCLDQDGRLITGQRVSPNTSKSSVFSTLRPETTNGHCGGSFQTASQCIPRAHTEQGPCYGPCPGPCPATLCRTHGPILDSSKCRGTSHTFPAAWNAFVFPSHCSDFI